MRRDWLWLGIVAIAFAYIEAAVVVYLRVLLYPDPLQIFPMAQPSPLLIGVEFGRELATLVLLAGVAILTARGAWGKLFRFFFLFGLWDLAYYGWLRVFIGWPKTPWDWDVLFLIPVPWLGPVLAPMLVALLLVISGLVYFSLLEHRKKPVMDPLPLALGAIGVGLVLASFWKDAWEVIRTHGVHYFQYYVPTTFAWPLFSIGWLLMVLAAWLFGRSFRGIEPLAQSLEEPYRPA